MAARCGALCRDDANPEYLAECKVNHGQCDCQNNLAAIAAALDEARIAGEIAGMREAQDLVEYLSPAFDVLQTMMDVGNLRMGANKAREMKQEVEVFLAATTARISELTAPPTEPSP